MTQILEDFIDSLPTPEIGNQVAVPTPALTDGQHRSGDATWLPQNSSHTAFGQMWGFFWFGLTAIIFFLPAASPAGLLKPNFDIFQDTQCVGDEYGGGVVDTN